MDDTLLRTTLEVAVPLHALRLRDLPWEQVAARAQAAADVIASKGDLILFRGAKQGETADAFNALAEGVAALAFAPGGVRVFGAHWDFQHPDVRAHEEKGT